MAYSNFGDANINFEDTAKVSQAYNDGFVFARTIQGQMQRVRSLRIDLKKFQESSENRRILRKFSHELKAHSTPFKDYTWQIHKLGKDFYEKKFGPDIFSANKIKELFTTKHNFNTILTFTNTESNQIDGYCIAYSSSDIIHYAYPFYNLDLINTSFGMYMMTKTITYFHDQEFKYIYLGSVHEKSSLYKLQFTGLEWWDEKDQDWNKDLEELKKRVLND